MADSTLVEQLTPIIAGGAVAVVSGYLGAQWSRAGSDRSWLRARRADVYTRGLEEANRAWSDLQRTWSGLPPSNDDFTEVLSRMFSIHAEIEMLGPSQVDKAYEELRASTRALSDRPGPTGPDESLAKTAEAQRMQAALNAYIKAAQGVIVGPGPRRGRRRLRRP